MEFDFEFMVNESYDILAQMTDNTKQTNKLVLPTMDIEICPTKLHWKNVTNYLEIINRHPDHFMEFLKRELPNKQIGWYSSNKSEGLLVHALRQKKNEIATLAIKYANNYVLCPCCKKYNSELNRDSETKKYEFKCNECGFNKYL
jgi:translation initiation factor 2 beta subunit (eIF-2beta)/eIF-5